MFADVIQYNLDRRFYVYTYGRNEIDIEFALDGRKKILRLDVWYALMLYVMSFLL